MVLIGQCHRVEEMAPVAAARPRRGDWDYIFAGLLGPDSRERMKNPFSFSKLVFQTNFEYKFKSI